MKFEELDELKQEYFENLKHGSNTIECDVQDALKDAKNLQEFKQKVEHKMDGLEDEIQTVRELLGTGRTYGRVSWCPEDALAEAESQGYKLTKEQATEVMERADGVLKDVQIENGWFVIREAVTEIVNKHRLEEAK